MGVVDLRRRGLGMQPPDAEAYKYFEGPSFIDKTTEIMQDVIQFSYIHHTEDGAGGDPQNCTAACTCQY